MKKLALITAIFFGLTGAAHALDLQTARSQGAVAEQATGYLKAVKPGAEVNALVDQVNAGRKAEYQRISKENGQPADIVAKLAAEQLMKKYP